MKKIPAILGVCALITVGATGCFNASAPTDNSTLNVMVTILPLQEFVEKIGGDHVTVNTVIPPGAEPHTYELSPQQLKQVADADVYVKAGTVEFEKANMGRIASLNKSMVIVDGSEGIALRKIEAHAHDEHAAEESDADEVLDPHTWLSPLNAKIYAQNIAKAFTELDPANAETYTANLEAYEYELDELDMELTNSFAAVGQKKIIVYHPAFGYLLDAYGMEQVPVELEGKEPTAEQLTGLIDEAREEGITVIFVQTQFSTSNAETIAQEIGGTVVQIDPLAKDFIANLRSIAQAITSKN
ncbi:MAG: zinc ABC transporter substrate-binding protein [Candidatus Kerfeldbacteria bacterium]